MNKTFLAAGIVLLLVIVGGGAYYLGFSQTQNKNMVADYTPSPTATPIMTPAMTASPSPAVPVAGKFSWHFTTVSEDAVTGPKTKVTLAADATGKTYDLGTHSGSCSTIETSAWQLLAGEKTGVICWWAGAGDELGVFDSNGTLLVKSGVIEEGDGETQGTRGDFKTVLEIK